MNVDCREQRTEGADADKRPPMKLPPRILVADDEPSLRRLIACVLGDSGYSVDAVEDGFEAWEALQANHYDVLITDNEMPKVSGVELIRRVEQAHLNLPIIMATASVPNAELNREGGVHPAALLVKPYTLAEMVETVESVLRANGQAAEAVEETFANLPAYQR
jgi:CheY-like chemotaxis protein